MKYDPETKTVERGPDDRERHRRIRERLSFSHKPTISEVTAAVDSLMNEGLLLSDAGIRESEAVARALKVERERQGLSLSELAMRTGWDEAEIADLETGQRPDASLQMLCAWAKALGKRLQLHVLDR